jgi:hypothetical protein
VLILCSWKDRLSFVDGLVADVNKLAQEVSDKAIYSLLAERRVSDALTWLDHHMEGI